MSKETSQTNVLKRKKSKREKSLADTKPTERELIELNEENFLMAMREQGGKDVTTAKLWPYFIRADTKPQQRFPVMMRMARKLEKAGKVSIVLNPERKQKQFLISRV